MRYQKIGRTDVQCSAVGFGTWGLGGDVNNAMAYGATNDEQSLAALNYALDTGITFYDTSNLYGYGHSEVLLGKAFSKVRDKVTIATKVGFSGTNNEQDFSLEQLKKSLENSLNRLSTDYVDMLMLHSPAPEEVLGNESIWDWLEQLKQEGVVRSYGVSTRSPMEGLDYLECVNLDCLQVNLNVTDMRAFDCGLLDKCAEKNVSVIARTPLVFGFLTGELEASSTFGSNDHRNRFSLAQKQKWHSAIKLYEKLFASYSHYTAAQQCLRFCLSSPAVATVIPGMLSQQHVKENCQAGVAPFFEPEEMKHFYAIYREFFL